MAEREVIEMVGQEGRAPDSLGVGVFPAARQLLRRAQAELDEADASDDPQMRFLHAHMAAIRAAAAVLAMAPPAPQRRRRRVLSVWEQLAAVDERWQGWAATFAAAASTRAAIESGRLSVLAPAVADAALAAAGDLVDEVRHTWSRAGRLDAALAS